MTRLQEVPQNAHRYLFQLIQNRNKRELKESKIYVTYVYHGYKPDHALLNLLHSNTYMHILTLSGGMVSSIFTRCM